MILCLCLSVAACGGVAPTPTPAPDAGQDATPDQQTDVAVDVVQDVTQDAPVEAPFCECVGADFGTYVCDGVQAPDAESCAYCGGHCQSTP